MSALIFTGGFAWKAWIRAHKANSALYANLANGLFARLYAKLLIPRLWT